MEIFTILYSSLVLHSWSHHPTHEVYKTPWSQQVLSISLYHISPFNSFHTQKQPYKVALVHNNLLKHFTKTTTYKHQITLIMALRHRPILAKRILKQLKQRRTPYHISETNFINFRWIVSVTYWHFSLNWYKSFYIVCAFRHNEWFPIKPQMFF